MACITGLGRFRSWNRVLPSAAGTSKSSRRHLFSWLFDGAFLEGRLPDLRSSFFALSLAVGALRWAVGWLSWSLLRDVRPTARSMGFCAVGFRLCLTFFQMFFNGPINWGLFLYIDWEIYFSRDKYGTNKWRISSSDSLMARGMDLANMSSKMMALTMESWLQAARSRLEKARLTI